MATRRVRKLCLIGLLAVGGCVRHVALPTAGSSRDNACTQSESLETVRLDTFTVGAAEFAIPSGWAPVSGTWQELRLTRVGAVLDVWRGTPFVQPGRLTPPTSRCALTRGDTTVVIEAIRSGFWYVVTATWDLGPEEENFTMRWVTPFVEHLKQVRAIVERVRFPGDSMRRAPIGSGGVERSGARN